MHGAQVQQGATGLPCLCGSLSCTTNPFDGRIRIWAVCGVSGAGQGSELGRVRCWVEDIKTYPASVVLSGVASWQTEDVFCCS